MDAQTLTRPKMRYYRFGFNPNTESPVFKMVGLPWKLFVACESGLLTREQMAQATEVLREVIKEAIADFDPSHALTHGEDEHGKYLLFHQNMVWSGTGERLAGRMRLVAYNTKEHLYNKPLPTHEHGDGSCEWERDGDESHCKVWSRQDEIENRAEIERDREKMTDSAYLDKLLDLLEERHILIPLRGEQLDAFLEGKFLLELPSNVTYEVHTNEGKKEKQGNVTLEGNGEPSSLPKQVRGLKRKGSPGGEGKEFGLLSDAAIQSCLAAGIDRNALRFLGTRSGCADTLNNPENTNTPAAARTIIKRTWFEPQFKQWLAKHP